MNELSAICNDVEQFRNIVSILRFYASASRVSYVDRLASAISISVVEKTIAEAVRELHTVTSTAIMVRGYRCRYDDDRKGYVCDQEVSLRCCDYDLLEEYLAKQVEGTEIFTIVRPIPERMRLASVFVLVKDVQPRIERLIGRIIACHLCPPIPSSNEIENMINCLKNGYWGLLHRIVANALTRGSKE